MHTSFYNYQLPNTGGGWPLGVASGGWASNVAGLLSGCGFFAGRGVVLGLVLPGEGLG